MKSFEVELQESYKRLRQYAMSFTHNVTSAEDLTQETMLKALCNRHLYQEGTNIRGWLSTIMKNLFFTQYRRKKSERSYIDFKMLFASDAVDPGQEAAMEQSEVFEEMSLLSLDQREAIRLIGIEGHSYVSAATISGAPVGTMKSRLSRGREQLKQALGSDRKASGAHFVVHPKDKVAQSLTLYGERFTLTETRRVISPGLPPRTIQIFRS
jgi:RNA polymerase sigma-70 factor (ECF subfamily)